MNKIKNIKLCLLLFFSNKENVLILSYFAVILGMLLINAMHEEYPDEYDNILGGKYLLSGVPIYKGFFTHHGPVAYFLSAFLLLFSRGSFVIFRLLFALLIFIFLLWSYYYQRNRFGREKTWFYLIFCGLATLAGNYYWLHMLLADSISAYFFAPVFSILLIVSFYKLRLRFRDILIISILTAASNLSSLTYLFFSFLIYGYSIYYFLKTNRLFIRPKSILYLSAIIAAPYIIFLFYLIATFSVKDYFYQGFTFNQRYYIYNYPRPSGSTTINPVRFAIVIANNFYNNYYTLLQQVPGLNMGFPLNITMSIGTFFLILYLLSKRLFLLALFYTGLLIYSNARSDPLTSKETDYQSAVYIIIAFISSVFLIKHIWSDLNKSIINHGNRYLYIALIFILSIYSLSSVMFLFQKFFNRTYEKYMGSAALIYDRSDIAPVMNKIINKDEYTWIGPFNFEDLFYLNAKVASRYQIFIPGLGAAPEVRKPFISEFERTKPKAIWFQKNFFILGRSPEMYGRFFIDYLNSYYITLNNYYENGVHYKSLLPINEKFDPETMLYIRRENKDEIIKRLLNNNFITPVHI